MDTLITTVNHAELTKRRADLLDRAGVPYDELRRRAEGSDLHGEEWRIWENVEAIDFLLGAGNGHRPS